MVLSGARLRMATLMAGLLFMLAVFGCGSNAEGDGVDYSGTWKAILDNAAGSFTMVVAGDAVTSLSWTFSYSATSGGTKCETTASCSGSGSCATPKSGSVNGNTLKVVSKLGDYDIAGTFNDPSSAAGTINYQIDSTTPLCRTSQTTTWTATKL